MRLADSPCSALKHNHRASLLKELLAAQPLCS